MKDVKRYSESCMEGGGVAPDPDGDLVDWKDYDNLEQECDSVAGKLRTALLDKAQVEAERDAALKQVEGLRELMAEAVPALQHISDTAQDLESFTLAERFRAALQAKP